MKILIIEDEPSLREIMQRALVQERYVVETASTYSEADAKIAAYSYDCILLDIMLPDGNGLQLLKHLKELRKRENIIIISARDSLDDKILGLDMGADDYLPKPFHTAELLARIKSVLRRGKSGGEMALILGNVSLEPESSRVLVNNKELSLLKKEFDILFYFMQRPNHLVDKSVLAEAVWIQTRSANRIKSPSHETHIPYSFTFIFNFDSAHGALGNSLLFYDGRRNQRRSR